MAQIRAGIDGGTKERVSLRVAEAGLDFETATDLAKCKAREICAEAMLLSWSNAETGEYFPTVECGCSGRPAWVVYAEARGADLTIDVNDGRFIFMFLKLAR
ncbi:MAG: AF1514 family protein [Desulfobacterales bacterium]